MPNKNYRKGKRFEYRIVKEFKQRKDCKFVTRTPGSHTSVDIIVLIGNTLYLIQAKNTKRKEKVTMPEVPKEVDVVKLLARNEKGKTVYEEIE